MKKDLQIKVKVKIANPVHIFQYQEIELIIDTGAPFSLIKRERLNKLNIPVLYKRNFKVANGYIIERDIGAVYFEIENKGKAIAETIFGEERDAEVMGLLTLEGMALTIDTTTGELKPIELCLL